MIANLPEKPHFDRIYAIEKRRAEDAEDVKELYKSAKDASVDVKRLRMAVRRALMDDDKKKEKRELEDAGDSLLEQLGPYADTPLGEAAMGRASA